VLLFVLLPFLQTSEEDRIAAKLFNPVIVITVVTVISRSKLALPTAELFALPALAATGAPFSPLRDAFLARQDRGRGAL
jgi:hypothetical protein